MRRPKLTKFGLKRDPKTRAPIPKRPLWGGVLVYKNVPCRRCGMTIVDNKCRCQTHPRKPGPPRPVPRPFTAFRKKESA